MTKTLINLTVTVIGEEIDSILDTYPEYPYQLAYVSLDLRQELMAYVLNRVQSVYIVVDENEQPSSPSQFQRYTLEESLRREAVIHQGIHYILHKKAERAGQEVLN